ncbi:hypothetical protein SUGI_0176380 [Cryptomeria japonica]|nr:hypothetical protein SUGI_0176380 [Cryptomeria japonica]
MGSSQVNLESIEGEGSLFRNLVVSTAVVMGGSALWAYKAIRPPAPNVCGSPSGPPITAPRIRLKDGRFLAYKESGVPKHKAKYKIVLAHGFMGTRDFVLPASKEVVEKWGVYFVSFDRAGYGESDPHPQRSVRSVAFDIEELADQLELGPRFYIMGISIGGHSVWSCLKYIPHRIQGATLVSPVINYRWSGFPAKVSGEAYRQQAIEDQWALRVLYYAPWLTYWWMTQNWFPSSTAIKGNWKSVNKQDNDMRSKAAADPNSIQRLSAIVQQGVFKSLHRELMVMFGKWEFDPMDLKIDGVNNLPVHVWQGDEDALVPVTLQRYICSRLPSIHYHELHEVGHLYYLIPHYADAILTALCGGS